RSSAAMLARRLPGYAARLATAELREALSEAACRADPASAFERGIIAPLAALPAPPEPRYFVIDALDEALSWSGAGGSIDKLIAQRIDRFPPWLRLVATTRKDPSIMNRLAGLRAREIETQDPRNRADIDAYARARLADSALKAKVAA